MHPLYITTDGSEYLIVENHDYKQCYNKNDEDRGYFESPFTGSHSPVTLSLVRKRRIGRLAVLSPFVCGFLV